MSSVPPSNLAVAACTFNSMRTVERMLRSVAALARRIVIVDSGSTDGTIELCRQFGAEVISRAWAGYIGQRQFALDRCAANPWVLLVDSDESLEPELQESIRRTIQEDDPRFRGWEMNRKVYFLDGWLHHVFQPEWRLRLVRGGAARVTGTEPHDTVRVEGRVGRLRGDLRHDSWADVDDMLRRSLAYAEQAAAAGAPGGSWWKILTSGRFALIKQLVLKRGLQDGRRGVIAAMGAALATSQKHMLIAERRARTARHAPTQSED